VRYCSAQLIRRDATSADPARTARFTASTGGGDRYGDVIDPAGWELKNFRANPVLLYGHASREMPIGRVTHVAVENDALMADAEATPEGVDPRADTAWALISSGFLRAVSVGFQPLPDGETPIRDPEGWITGWHYSHQELLELSVVTVPANAAALAVAKSYGGEALFGGELDGGARRRGQAAAARRAEPVAKQFEAERRRMRLRLLNLGACRR